MPTSLKQFEAVFPSLEADLSDAVKATGLPESAYEWYMKVGGKAEQFRQWRI